MHILQWIPHDNMLYTQLFAHIGGPCPCFMTRTLTMHLHEKEEKTHKKMQIKCLCTT